MLIELSNTKGIEGDFKNLPLQRRASLTPLC